MSRLFVSSSSQYLEYSGLVDGTTPLTLSCWCKPNSIGAGNIRMLMAQGVNNSGDNFFRLQINANLTIGAVTRDTGQSAANTTTSVTVDTWSHACAVFLASNSRSVYCNGSGKGTSTTSRTPSGINNTRIGITTNNLLGMDGSIAEAAIWNAALTDDEVMSLANGIRPINIRSDLLVAYWSLRGLQSPEPDIISGFNLTVNGATQDGNPPLTYLNADGKSF